MRLGTHVNLRRGSPATVFKPVLAAVLAWTGAADAAQVAVAVPRHLIVPDAPRIEDPEQVVRLFLQAVDRGELVVFDHVLARTMLDPLRVEYVYDLVTRTMQIRVYANLKDPLPVPGRSDCRIRGVSALMNGEAIVEVESHIWMNP